MNGIDITLQGARLTALGSGALWWPDEALLCVSDLHFGKSDRIARRQGLMLPPYEVRATLDRLEADVARTGAARILCLGDSFDDLDAVQALDHSERDRLAELQRGRDWLWVEGNHDPGPSGLGGSHHDELRIGPLTFRHIARPGAEAELSGHYHPKLGLPGCGAARPCFLFDAARMILPAYGAYTGGLRATGPELQALFGSPAFAVLTGPTPLLAPLKPHYTGAARLRARR